MGNSMRRMGRLALVLLAASMGGGAALAQDGQKICDEWFKACFVVKGKPPYTPDNPFVAGVKPNQRPEGAPVIVAYEKDAAWYERALHGVSEPYPWSLRFLEDQGAWFNPFVHPGMTPPYDIRGWHQAKLRKAAAAVKPRPRKKLRKRKKDKRKKRR